MSQTTFTRRRALLCAGLVLALSVALGASWPLWLRLSGNFHSVVEGQIFRSAQPSANDLQTLIRSQGLKTVINLRGVRVDDEGFRAELATTAAFGVHYVGIPLSANEEPDDAQLRSLIGAMRTAETPVLIHCEGGADRTGLASALYRLLVMGDRPDEAAQQLSFRYGHFPWAISRTGAMDRAFWRVVNAPDRFKTAD